MALLNERIRIARTLAGLSQDDVAKNLGVQRSVVVRYEQERKPSDSSLEKISALTGMPLEWLWGNDVKGIYVFQPERPGCTYSHPQVRMKEQALDRDWPRLLEILAIKTIFLLRCKLGGVIIACNDSVCIVVVGTHSIDTIRRVSTGSEVSFESKSVDDVDFLNVWMQPKFAYLKKILSSAGEHLEHFIAKIPDGDFYSNFTQWEIELEVGGDTDDVYKSIEEHDKELLKSIESFLTGECHLKILHFSMKRLSSIIPGAPPYWKFKRLEHIPDASDDFESGFVYEVE